MGQHLLKLPLRELPLRTPTAVEGNGLGVQANARVDALEHGVEPARLFREPLEVLPQQPRDRERADGIRRQSRRPEPPDICHKPKGEPGEPHQRLRTGINERAKADGPRAHSIPATHIGNIVRDAAIEVNDAAIQAAESIEEIVPADTVEQIVLDIPADVPANLTHHPPHHLPPEGLNHGQREAPAEGADEALLVQAHQAGHHLSVVQR